MFQKILLATDGSKGALTAAEAAADLTKRYAAELTVLYVNSLPVELTPYMVPAELPIMPDAFLQYSEEMKKEAVRRTEQVLTTAGVKYSLRYEVGHAAEWIVRIAKEDNFDVIVVGNRGLTGLGSFFLGSVSNRVCDYAPCTVLVVKEKEEDPD